jgi:mono/diheme cytochrome c family protein
LAQERCARCHLIDHPTRGPLVGGQGVKSEARASPNPSAPPFVVIALSYRPADLEEALVEGVLVGHDDASKNPAMPEFSFPPAQARDLVAYLESLAR